MVTVRHQPEVIVSLTGHELMGKPIFRTPAQRRVLIAYRMQNDKSIAMRKELGRLLEARKIEVLDGQVKNFDDWPTIIRKRISSARMVIADASGPSREILFEMGFSGAKALLPIVEKEEDRNAIPSWITSQHVPEYRGTGVSSIATSVDLAFSSPPKLLRRPLSAPGKISWIEDEGADWCHRARDLVENACREAGLTFNVYNYALYSPEELMELCSSWIVVGAVDGTRQDYLTHFMLGDVASRRGAGSGRKMGEGLMRTAILMTPSDRPRDQWVASSVLRVTRDIISPATELTCPALVLGHIKRFQRWLRDRPIPPRGADE